MKAGEEGGEARWRKCLSEGGEYARQAAPAAHTTHISSIRTLHVFCTRAILTLCGTLYMLYTDSVFSMRQPRGEGSRPRGEEFEFSTRQPRGEGRVLKIVATQG